MAQYNTFSLETCFEMAYAMGVDMSYEQYEALLLDEADTKALAKKDLSTIQRGRKRIHF